MNKQGLPEKLLGSLKNIKGFDEKAFTEAHALGELVTSIRFNPNKPSEEIENESAETDLSSLSIQEKIPWSSNGYYLSKRPLFTLDPLLHAGAYYVQEASSMFLEEALKQSVDLSKPLRV